MGSWRGITDLRDESDRQGLRIVIELTKNVEPEKVLAALYKRTPMQSTFSINLLALVDNEPRLLNLKQALRVYLDHRLAGHQAPQPSSTWKRRVPGRTSSKA